MNYKVKTLFTHLFLDAVNCIWSQWEEWSTCTKPCGFGSKSRNRTILVEASNGGVDCSGPTEMAISCNEGECKGNAMFPSNMYALSSISISLACSTKASIFQNFPG